MFPPICSLSWGSLKTKGHSWKKISLLWSLGEFHFKSTQLSLVLVVAFPIRCSGNAKCSRGKSSRESRQISLSLFLCCLVSAFLGARIHFHPETWASLGTLRFKGGRTISVFRIGIYCWPQRQDEVRGAQPIHRSPTSSPKTQSVFLPLPLFEGVV